MINVSTRIEGILEGTERYRPVLEGSLNGDGTVNLVITNIINPDIPPQSTFIRVPLADLFLFSQASYVANQAQEGAPRER